MGQLNIYNHDTLMENLHKQASYHYLFSVIIRPHAECDGGYGVQLWSCDRQHILATQWRFKLRWDKRMYIQYLLI